MTQTLPSRRPILLISGTNRPGSNTARVSRVIERHYQSNDIPVNFLDLVNLPPEAFLPSVYATKPASVVALQQRVLDAAGLHVVTPEYNGSFPGVLKHFIDLLKFPESFEHKPVAFTGVAAGMFGALCAVEQLQMIFGYRNAHGFPDRVFIPSVHSLFNADGGLSDTALDQRLARQARFCRVCPCSRSGKTRVTRDRFRRPK